MSNSSSDSRRPGSKLEVDDPDYCKRCGAEIQCDDDADWVVRDEDGVYESYDGRGEWKRVEKCIDCWLDSELAVLRTRAESIYDGELPEVLRR